tara:strand:+ start:339 stop:572 length:234 start_codon:yes stop_codon:yes gene_type:complete
MKKEDPIWDTPEYEKKIKEFNLIKDRPVALTMSTDSTLPLSEAIQIYDLEKANELQKLGEIYILILCFNEIVTVKKV